MPRLSRLLLVLAPLALAACVSESSDGAVVRYGPGPLQCQWVQLGTSHDQITRLSQGDYMFYTVSSRGRVHDELYILPDGAPPGLELDETNGELALEVDLDRDSFADEEVLYYDAMTRDGYPLDVVYWFTEDCDDLDPPESFEPP